MGVWRDKFINWVKSQSNKRKILIGIVVTLVAIAILYQFEWSGFGKDENKSETTKVLINPRTGEKTEFTEKTTSLQSAKTLWDWLGLGGTIAIPIGLFYFELREQRRSEKRSQELEENTKREKEIAEENAKREKEIADNNLREQALEAYIDRMSELLIDKNLKILISEGVKGLNRDNPILDAALDIARARTLSVLRRLDQDKERKGHVIRFLVDAELVSNLDLSDADLCNTNLSSANLLGAKFERAKLEGVNLNFTNLRSANLLGAYLLGAKLEGANLDFTNLSLAILKDAYLVSADLSNAYIVCAYLTSADLSNANLTSADLSYANLTSADLSNANLTSADLSNANLTSANLSNTNLKDAKLIYAKNLTLEQIKEAINWELAIYNDEFRAELGLPPDK